MFYSQYILARKGPLGKIWLAAHFEKKLTKSQVFATDITESVQTIVNPTVPLALRVSGHLMLGIVRIYSDKVRYLSTDCRDAMTRINLAFKTQTNRVDIDENIAGKIDDANYALLPMDDDDQSNQVAFHRKVVRSIPKLDESDVTSFFAIGDIELLRNDLSSRPSIQSRRQSVVVDTSRRSIEPSIAKADDDILPAFDAHIGENFFNDSQFGGYEPFELPVDSNNSAIGRAASIAAVPSDQEDHFDFPAATETTVVKAKTMRTKRRKVEINDQVEIPDKQWKQRLVDVHSIVRQPRTLLSEEEMVTDTHTDDVFENITGSLQYCPELGSLVGIFSGRNAEQFPFLQELQKRDLTEQQPELVRRESGVNAVEIASPQLASSARRSLDTRGEQYEPRESFAPDMSHDYMNQYDYGMDENLPVDESKGFVPTAVEKSLLATEAAPQEDISEEQKSERTKMVFSIIEQELQEKGSESLQTFCSGCSKAVAARFFLELLQLKTWGKLELTQENSYDPIMVQLV